MTQPSETTHANKHQNEYAVASANGGDVWLQAKAAKLQGVLREEMKLHCWASHGIQVVLNAPRNVLLMKRGGTSRFDFLKHGQALITALLVAGGSKFSSPRRARHPRDGPFTCLLVCL